MPMRRRPPAIELLDCVEILPTAPGEPSRRGIVGGVAPRKVARHRPLVLDVVLLDGEDESKIVTVRRDRIRLLPRPFPA